jgi:hypothetical protein
MPMHIGRWVVTAMAMAIVLVIAVAAVPGLLAWPLLPAHRINQMFRLIGALRGWTHDLLHNPE